MSKDNSKHSDNKNSKKGMTVFWVIIGIVVLVFVSQFLFKGTPDGSDNINAFTASATTNLEPTELDSFAQCLTEKGAVFYGTEWCGHCKNQKEMFGSSMQYINFVDCDENRAACQAAGVPGYPTWAVPETDNLVGTQPLTNLASATGCAL